ncbi:MAG: RNA polymerase sigma factor [Desulfobulbaceae bacterium]|nr:RNA polymerase sigma factor [Desulfobulbaceae bacterium]
MARQNISDADEFEMLVTPHIENMYRLAYRFTGNTADAEDLVQDVLVKVYPRRQEVARIEKLRPWLVKILYRVFVDQHRRAVRSPLRLLKFTSSNDDDFDETLKNIPTEDPGPAEIIDRKLNYSRILQALDLLNDDQRHLCILHDVEGYTLSELVDILNVPLGTLKSRLHRARAALRQQLNRGTF